MKITTRSLCLIGAGSLALGAFASLSGTQATLPGLGAQPVRATAIAGDDFVVDAVHSSVVFRIKHMDISHVFGRFNDPEGSFNIDAENPEKTMIDVRVRTANVDTANSSRDNHLRSPDFFNANQFPNLTFKSTSARAHTDGTIHVTGDLTYRGVTKSITLPVTKTGEGDTRQGYKQGFITEFTIKRSDFGDTWGIDNGALADQVTLIVSLQGKRG
ncbi:MAG: YceI family protein [Phycisphaerales bacterium]